MRVNNNSRRGWDACYGRTAHQVPIRGYGRREIGGHMITSHNKYTRRAGLRILHDEINNETFYYMDGVQIYEEDVIFEDEREDEDDETPLRDN